MTKYYYMNGKFFTEDKALVSVNDRGVRFGDGVFDTIKVVSGKPLRFDLYNARIKGGLEALKIDYDISNLESEILKTIKENNIQNGFARVQITRGQGSCGYLPTNDTSPTLIIEAVEMGGITLSDVKLCISSYTKPSIKSLPVNYKIMQGVNSTLAKIEAVEKGFFDGLLLNDTAQVCECSSSNIFWVRKGGVFTPSLEAGVLDGVTRRIVIESLKNDVIEGFFGLEDLRRADEVFITNSLVEVQSVSEIYGIFKNKGDENKVTERVKSLYQSSLTGR